MLISTMSIEDIQTEIVEEFELLDNKNDRYNYIIEIGKKLPTLDTLHLQDENLIKGCQSKVWLVAHYENGNVFFEADSDSVLVRGLVSLLIRVFSGHTPEEIIRSNFDFIEKIGLHQMLSMNRSNGLASMIKQMKLYALAFKTQHQI